MTPQSLQVIAVPTQATASEDGSEIILGTSVSFGDDEPMPVLLDIEASSLRGPLSYPVEVAWCRHDLRSGRSLLIAPAADWDDWDPGAEKVHGLSRHVLEWSGLPIGEVAALLNRDLAGAKVLSDSPETDWRWLCRLYWKAGVEPAFAMVNECSPAAAGGEDVERIAAELHAETGLRRHRALDDAIGHALRLAAVEMLRVAAEEGGAAAAAQCAEMAGRARRLLEREGRRT